MEGKPAEPEPVVLHTPAQFKALGHPVRHRIVNVLRQRPATLRQLGSVMGLAKGTISFHLRVLREAGLVQVSGTQQVRGGTEQHFTLVSPAFRLHEDAAEGQEFLVQAALAEMLPARSDETGQTSLRHLWLSPQQARDLAARLQSCLSQPHATDTASGATDTASGATDTADGEAYGLLVSLYRADIPKLPAAE